MSKKIMLQRGNARERRAFERDARLKKGGPINAPLPRGTNKMEATKYLLATTHTGCHTLVAATLEFMYTVAARRPALETPIVRTGSSATSPISVVCTCTVYTVCVAYCGPQLYAAEPKWQ